MNGKQLAAMACQEAGPMIPARRKGAKDQQARCNRPAGHDGPHAVYRAETFAKVVEWGGA